MPFRVVIELTRCTIPAPKVGGFAIERAAPSQGRRCSASGGSWGLRSPSVAKLALLLVSAVVMLVLGGIRTASAIGAENGDGTAGYFVAQNYYCGGRPALCNWVGQFQLAGGTVARSRTDFYGSDQDMTVGSVVPAVDTGDPFGVYQPHGSGLWTYSVTFLVLGLIALLGAAAMARSLWSGGTVGSASDGLGQPESWSGAGP